MGGLGCCFDCSPESEAEFNCNANLQLLIRAVKTLTLVRSSENKLIFWRTSWFSSNLPGWSGERWPCYIMQKTKLKKISTLLLASTESDQALINLSTGRNCASLNFFLKLNDSYKSLGKSFLIRASWFCHHSSRLASDVQLLRHTLPGGFRLQSRFWRWAKLQSNFKLLSGGGVDCSQKLKHPPPRNHKLGCRSRSKTVVPWDLCVVAKFLWVAQVGH